MTYAAAAIGGLVLVIGFAYFNSLHREFLSANFDSVHGARTLLKARFLIDQAARDVEMAAIDTNRHSQLMQSADKRLLNAENYSAEGKDNDPAAREKLVNRIRTARQALQRLAQSGNGVGVTGETSVFTTELQQLARDVDGAELDRWGTLAGLNAELAARMRTLNYLIAAAFLLFVAVMLALAWALRRTRGAEAESQAAKTEAEAIQQTTLDASPIGIAFIDTTDDGNQRITAVNRQMAVIFDYEPEMMAGLNVRRLYANQGTYLQMSRSAPAQLAQGGVLREEVVMQRRSGMPFWCSLSIKAINPADIARGVVWTCEDITERKTAEATLQQERSRAEAASQAKSTFLANMSHELRTPFTGLFGLLDLLRQSPLDEKQKQYVDLARGSASQMQAIVNDILDFSKIEAGKLIIDVIPFRLRPLISSVANSHATAAQRKGLRFTLDLVEPLVETLHGDPVRIRQIIDNLLNNAIKFTERGEIRLIVQSQSRSSDEALLRITVEDTGIGISPRMQSAIFEKFTQADSSTTRLYGGTGLGLAISKQLSELMGGSISLSSSEGRGSRFMLTLNLMQARDAAIPAEDNFDATHAGRLDGVVILLAEDNDINRNMLAETLEWMGAIVWTASDGEAAVRMVTEHAPDVVLMDCQMPRVDGLEASRRIRAAEVPGKHVPIIAITAFATSNYRDECLLAGMDSYLPKPATPRALLAAIQSMLPDAVVPAAALLCGRILLVDDNAAIREISQTLIARLGCEVESAADGASALLLLEATANCASQELESEFDLVLMDCNMPTLDGWETTQRWRQREHELGLTRLAIIAVTADDRPEIRERCLNSGMDDTLTKPFTEERLQTLLADWLC